MRRPAGRVALVAVAIAVLLLAGCAPGGLLDRLFGRAPPPAVADIHVVVGEPYRIGGAWRYPRVSYTLDETGLAAVVGTSHPRLTTDGEIYDATAPAAGHRTLQLPAIARVGNLDTGLSVVVRVNDRGPAAPGRLVELTPRAAALIGAADGSRVRVQVLEGESRRLAAQLGGDGPRLDMATAPAGTVTSEPLAPPAGAAGTRAGRIAPAAAGPVAADAPEPPIPLRLPEQVTQGPVVGGALYIDTGAFSRLEYARLMANRLVALGAQVSTDYAAPRDRAYVVRIGPFGSAGEADAALDRAMAAGVTDARIVVGY